MNKIKEIPLDIVAEITLLKDKNIRYVSVYFQGSNDEGSVEDIFLFTPMEMNDEFETLNSIQNDISISDKLFNYFDDLAMKHSSSYDWWNNDGGYGNFFLNLDTFEYKTEYNIYYTQTSTYSEEGSLNL